MVRRAKNQTTKPVEAVKLSKPKSKPVKQGLGLLGNISPALGVDLEKYGLVPAMPEQSKEIFQMYMQYKDLFPHLRQDYIERKIQGQECVLYGTCASIISRYKKKTRLGDCHALRGDWISHQSVNLEQGNGHMKKFIEKVIRMIDKEGGDFWTCIRVENVRSISFRKKMGFVEVGEINWMQGKLPGVVMVRRRGAF